MTRRNSPIEGSSRRRWRDRLAVALIGLICGATVALGDEARDSTTVTFPSAWTIDATQISAELFVPDGDGPFPALVLLHGSSGIGEENYIWAARFRSMGLGSRGIEKHPKQPYVHLQFGDAYGALAYLQRQPFADENRIGVIGWSHGGYAVLHAARVNGRISRIRSMGYVALVVDSLGSVSKSTPNSHTCTSNSVMHMEPWRICNANPSPTRIG